MDWTMAFASRPVASLAEPSAAAATVAPVSSSEADQQPASKPRSRQSSPPPPAKPPEPAELASTQSATGSPDEHSGGRKKPKETGRVLSSEEQRKIKHMRAQRQRANQIHWRARQPARGLTDAERHEIQSRLYTSRAPPRAAHAATSRLQAHGSSCCSHASAAERSGLVDPSPSALAAATGARVEQVLEGRTRRAKTSRLDQHGASSPDDHACGGGACSSSSGGDGALRPRAASGWQQQPSPPRARSALPDGWKTASDSNGRTYYYHRASGTTSWEPPPRPKGEAAISSRSSNGTSNRASTEGGTNRVSTERTEGGAAAASSRKSARARTDRTLGAASTRSRPGTSRSGALLSRRDQFHNSQYKPTALGTEPIPVAPHDGGWVGIGGRPEVSRDMERRMANPAADIEGLAGGTRAFTAKTPGPPRVAQQWKEGLREIVPHTCAPPSHGTPPIVCPLDGAHMLP